MHDALLVEVFLSRGISEEYVLEPQPRYGDRELLVCGLQPRYYPGRGPCEMTGFRGAPAARGLNRRPGEYGDAPLRLLRSFGIYIYIPAPLLHRSFLRSLLSSGLSCAARFCAACSRAARSWAACSRASLSRIILLVFSPVAGCDLEDAAV